MADDFKMTELRPPLEAWQVVRSGRTSRPCWRSGRMHIRPDAIRILNPYLPVRFLISSVSSGTISLASPTTP
ncbi:MAG: hypothetical protein KatS3mg058_3683 [Roseiflexus sp.]|nr:MAG: hypothetical protein KatS3mg058_3683 [Roseiflexus sp.]